ncbi:MAG TPA: hypothetical protein VK636_08415 [Gemmatimonadaceae bacterium]|nr:hypothetical protein [Gemmatimonadaceae bacterium]
MKNRMSLLASSCFILLAGTTISSLAMQVPGQMPFVCYAFSYRPDSITAYVPARIDLYRAKVRDGQFLARWQPMPGERAARALFQSTRGFAEWRERHDSLTLSISPSLTGPPSGSSISALASMTGGMELFTITPSQADTLNRCSAPRTPIERHVDRHAIARRLLRVFRIRIVSRADASIASRQMSETVVHRGD